MRHIHVKTNNKAKWEDVDAVEVRVELPDGHLELTIKKKEA